MKSGRWQNELCAAAFVQQQDETAPHRVALKAAVPPTATGGTIALNQKNNLGEICNKLISFSSSTETFGTANGSLKKK